MPATRLPDVARDRLEDGGPAPELAPTVNINLLTVAVTILMAALAVSFSLSGNSPVARVRDGDEPLDWAGRNISETLSVLSAASTVGALTLVVDTSRRPWFGALGLAAGGMTVTRQMLLPITFEAARLRAIGTETNPHVGLGRFGLSNAGVPNSVRAMTRPVDAQGPPASFRGSMWVA